MHDLWKVKFPWDFYWKKQNIQAKEVYWLKQKCKGQENQF